MNTYSGSCMHDRIVLPFSWTHCPSYLPLFPKYLQDAKAVLLQAIDVIMSKHKSYITPSYLD
jgi:hypothetical protein